MFVAWRSNGLVRISAEDFSLWSSMAFNPNLFCSSMASPKDQCFILFCLPCTRNPYVICRHMCGFHKSADDTQLRNSTQPCDFRLFTGRVENSIREVKQWMTCNKLKLNGDKMEATTLGTQLSSVSCGEHQSCNLVIMKFLSNH